MVIKGKDLIFSLSVNGTSEPLIFCKTCTLTQSADTLETTTRGSGSAKSFDYGKTSYQLSLTSFSALIANYSSLFLQNCLNGRVKLDWSFQFDRVIYYSGTVLVTQAQMDAAFDGVSSFTGTLLGDGPLNVTSTAPPISGNFNYIRVFNGDPRLTVNGLGQQVFTDNALIGLTDYPVFATQVASYFSLDQLTYNPTAGSFTIVTPGLLVLPGSDLIIYPFQLQA